MGESSFLTKSRPALEILQLLSEALVAALPGQSIAEPANIRTNLAQGHASLAQGVMKEAFKTLIQGLPASFTDFPFVRIQEFTFSISGASRNGQNVRLQYNETENANAGTIKFIEPESWQPDLLSKALREIDAKFTLRTRQELAIEGADAWQRDVLRAHQDATQHLAASVAQLGAFLGKQTEELSSFLKKKVDDVDERYAAREKVLEEKIAKREQELDDRAAALRAKEAAIDARDRTTTRRDLLKRISELLKEQQKAELSPETSKKRQVVFRTCVAAMIFAAFLVLLGGAIVLESRDYAWFKLAPLSSGLVLLGSTLVFFLRWSDAWFRDHARAEFHAKRNQADVLRASWVAELYFEWMEKPDAQEFPAHLGEQLTRNLFVIPDDADVKHPAEQVLGVLKNAQLKAGELEINTGKKK